MNHTSAESDSPSSAGTDTGSGLCAQLRTGTPVIRVPSENQGKRKNNGVPNCTGKKQEVEEERNRKRRSVNKITFLKNTSFQSEDGSTCLESQNWEAEEEGLRIEARPDYMSNKNYLISESSIFLKNTAPYCATVGKIPSSALPTLV